MEFRLFQQAVIPGLVRDRPWRGEKEAIEINDKNYSRSRVPESARQLSGIDGEHTSHDRYIFHLTQENRKISLSEEAISEPG
jgi:hypothetical protein